MARPAPCVGWVSFQIRTPLPLKEKLVRSAHTSGCSQQAIVIAALEEYFATHGPLEAPRAPTSPGPLDEHALFGLRTEQRH